MQSITEGFHSGTTLEAQPGRQYFFALPAFRLRADAFAYVEDMDPRGQHRAEWRFTVTDEADREAPLRYALPVRDEADADTLAAQFALFGLTFEHRSNLPALGADVVGRTCHLRAASFDRLPEALDVQWAFWVPTASQAGGCEPPYGLFRREGTEALWEDVAEARKEAWRRHQSFESEPIFKLTIDKTEYEDDGAGGLGGDLQLAGRVVKHAWRHGHR